MSMVYLNGRMMPLSEARASVLDRGFIFADGVYEVIPAFAGRPFRPAAHLARSRITCRRAAGRRHAWAHP